MRAYSRDIRTKVVEAYHRGEGSQRAIAARFDVSLSFVRDLIKLYRETGSVAPRQSNSNGHKHYKLGPETLEFLSQAMNQHPGLSLTQLCNKLAVERSVCVSRATLWRAIKQHRASDQASSKANLSLHDPLTPLEHDRNSPQSIGSRGELV